MANVRITDLTSLSRATFGALDLLEVVDVSDTTDNPNGSSFKVTRDDIRIAIGDPLGSANQVYFADGSANVAQSSSMTFANEQFTLTNTAGGGDMFFVKTNLGHEVMTHVSARPRIKWTGSTGTSWMSGRGNGFHFAPVTADASAMVQVSAFNSASVAMIVEGAAAQSADIFQARSDGASTGDYVTVDSIGQVGLNIAVPTVRLDVNGVVKVRERLLLAKGSDVASAGDITLGDGNAFEVTGTTSINTISGTDWTEGSIISLHFNANIIINHNGSGTGDSILLSGSGNYSATNNDNLTLQLMASNWVELTRTQI